MSNPSTTDTRATTPEQKIPLAKAGDAFDALDKVVKGILSVFLAAKGLGLLPAKMNLTIEQLILPVVLVFVVMSSLPAIRRWAFPSQTPPTTSRSTSLSRKLMLRPAALALYGLLILATAAYWTKREIINEPPQILHILPQNGVIVPNDSTTLKVIVLDPDGSQDIARMEWSPNSIDSLNPPSNDIVRFQAPPAEGAYNIYVTVTDRSGKTDTDSITIYVVSPLQ